MRKGWILGWGIMAAVAGMVSSALAAPQALSDPLPGKAQTSPVIAGMITNPAIRETSGIAPSRLSRNVFWTLNDSGNSPDLFAIGPQGESLGTCRVQAVRNRDWEDLASFRLEGIAYLLVADTGDNNGKRQDCALMVVREPDVTSRQVAVAWSLPFRYADGPRDCEAVAVDVGSERVLLLSKRTVPPVLYELPLRPPPAGTTSVAVRVTSVASVPAPAGSGHRHYWTQPTAMDVSPDGTTLAVLTYEHVYLYPRRPGEHWPEALSRTPLCLVLPPEDTGVLRQREALCYAPDGRRLYVAGEGCPAQLGWVDLSGPAP